MVSYIKNILLSRKSPVNRYIFNILDSILSSIVIIGFVVLIFSVIFQLCKALWNTYLYTNIGQNYSVLNPESVQIVSDIFSPQVGILSITITFYSFTVCSCVGVIFQFFHIIRNAYSPRSIIEQLLIFGLPISFVVAFLLYQLHIAPSIIVGFVWAVFPTLSLFANCFRLSECLIPEIGEILFAIVSQSKKIIKHLPKVRTRILKRLYRTTD